MKIAVIGTGIAGNVAAYHLAREHEITVFEADNRIGGHTNTVGALRITSELHGTGGVGYVRSRLGLPPRHTEWAKWQPHGWRVEWCAAVVGRCPSTSSKRMGAGM